MKKLCLFILTLSLLFSSCGKNKTNIGGKKVSRFKQIGEITPDFGNEKFKAFENEDWKVNFTEKTIDKYDEVNLSVIDVYPKDNSFILVSESKNGEIVYSKVTGDNLNVSKASENEVIDDFVINNLNDNDELWGYQKFQNYYLIIKNQQTYIYKDGKLLSQIKGIGRIADIDNDGQIELVCNVDEKKLIIYRLKANNAVKLWEFTSKDISFNGNIQIADFNGDGVKEIYAGDVIQNMRKFVLTNKGFYEDKSLPVKYEEKQVGNYYFVDYNKDGKMDIIVTLKDAKPKLFIQKNEKQPIAASRKSMDLKKLF